MLHPQYDSQQHSPHEPPLPEDPQGKQRNHHRPADQTVPPSEQGVDDVSPVQLSDGKQIDRRYKQPDPTRKSHRIQDHVVSLGHVSDHRVRKEGKQE